LRVALLEDDPDQGRLLKEWLLEGGHRCDHYATSKEFVQHIKRDSYDLLILDWLVPDMSGLDVLKWVRQTADSKVPVIFVTKREREEDIVQALENGADDYMTKPVKHRELLARMTALERRLSEIDDTQNVIEVAPFRIDRVNRTVEAGDKKVELTQKECDLTVFLFKNVGRVLSRGHILESVWGRNPDINTRTVDTHISRIRSKLGIAPEIGWRLSSIYQHGYRLERLEAE
jgi:two-component system response regulator RegX3